MQNAASSFSRFSPLASRFHRLALGLLAAVLFAAAHPVARAQALTSGVPGLISYQGQVLDNTGAPVGDTASVNRKVTFRIWDHPSNTLAAHLIYSEEQTVTIAKGKFSVLIGGGVNTLTNLFGYSEVSKGPTTFPIINAFNGPSRYLGITVDDGTAAVDYEITPRQQFVSTAYAFRAKFAEQLGTAANTTNAVTVLDSGNIGVGNPAAPARFTVTGGSPVTTSSTLPQFLVTDSADTSKGLRIGVDNTGNGTGFLQSFRTGTGAQPLLLNPGGGNVGVGVTSASSSLTVGGGVRAKGGTGANTGYTFSHPGVGGLYSEDGRLSLFTNGSLRMQMDASGNIGAGTFLGPGAGVFGSRVSVDSSTSPLQVYVAGQGSLFTIGANGGAKIGIYDSQVPIDGLKMQRPVGIGTGAAPLTASLTVGTGNLAAIGGYISAGPSNGDRIVIDDNAIQKLRLVSGFPIGGHLGLNEYGGNVAIGNSASSTTIGNNLTVGDSSTTATTTLNGPLRITGRVSPSTPTANGLVVRRVESTGNSDRVAVTQYLGLKRDGTPAGVGIEVLVSNGFNTLIVARGVTVSGASLNKVITLDSSNVAPVGTIHPLYTDADAIVLFTVDIGIPYQNNNQTSVTLMREQNDFYWSGTLTSTVNQ